jgi:hypothetical protein
MPLPPAEIEREALHTRTVRVDSYARADGQWDLDAELIDTKHYDFEHAMAEGGVHRTGDPVHHMRLRVTFDETYTITAAHAVYDAAPYGKHCAAIESEYQNLVGMNLLKGFRDTVKRRFARTAGCTHMTELSYVLPTVAVQTMSSRRRAERAVDDGQRPFQLDGCHALDVKGPAVQEFYPKWYVTPATEP